MTKERVAALVQPYLWFEGQEARLNDDVYERLGSYLDLLVRWNARTNLTAVREPEEMVRRHFGESLFAGLCLRSQIGEEGAVLDWGSGAGFPGVPIQLLLPRMKVTLAESQGKKVAFLREGVRTLGLTCQVWAGRAEALPETLQFEGVTLRAVDQMGAMLAMARGRVRPGGVLLEMGGELAGAAGVEPAREWAMPQRSGSFVRAWRVG